MTYATGESNRVLSQETYRYGPEHSIASGIDTLLSTIQSRALYTSEMQAKIVIWLSNAVTTVLLEGWYPEELQVLRY